MRRSKRIRDGSNVNDEMIFEYHMEIFGYKRQVHDEQHADGVDNHNITQGKDINQEREDLHCADNNELQGTKSDVKSCHWNRGETEDFPDESGNGSGELRLLEVETKSD